MIDQEPTLSVCVVTYERAQYLHRCLSALEGQHAEILEVVVVDASATAIAVDGYSPLVVKYIHAPRHAGWMTRSRNEALLHAKGDVVAFIDDDVIVRDGWAAAVRSAFVQTRAAAIAGRTCNGLPGEESYSAPIGCLLPNGSLTDGFASKTRSRLEVQHGIGANMSFRRSCLLELGGFRDDYPGTALREDTDAFLRVGAIGGLVLFDPEACVDHRPAPHIRGQRFDTRYKLYARRNHVVLLARHAGIASPLLRTWCTNELQRVWAVAGLKRRLARLGVTVIGLGWGLAALPGRARLRALDPRRQGRNADAVRRALQAAAMGPSGVS